MSPGGSGRFPAGSPVHVRFPRTAAERHGPREGWPWLPGTVLAQRGEDEWEIQVDVPIEGNPDGYLDTCFRDASEIRER